MSQLRSILRPIFKLPLLPVWLAPLVLLAPVYLTGRVLFWGVPLLQFAPWWKYAWDTLLAGHLPLWNPWVGMGAPLLANYQSALFYPPNWSYFLAYLLGGLGGLAWLQALLLALHLAWAGLGMAFLIRRLGLGELPQAVSGLAYGLSGYLVGRASFLSINAATAWLPWILLCLTPLLPGLLPSGQLPAGQQPRPIRLRSRRFLWAVVCMSLQLLAGHAQTTWYTLLLAGLWVAFWAWKTSGPGGYLAAGETRARSPAFSLRLAAVLRAELVMAGVVLLAVILASAQLLPTAEYLFQSQRSSAVDYKFAMNYSFWPWHILTVLAPGLFGSPVSGDYWGYAYIWEDAIYVGLLPFLLALSALLQRERSKRNPLTTHQALAEASPAQAHGRQALAGLPAFLLAIFAVSLLFALGDNTPVFPWLYRHVPTFAMFQAPARWMLWGVVALSILAGLGAEAWRRPDGRGLYWTRLGTMGAFAITLGAALAWLSLGEVSPSFIRAMALMGLWAVFAGILSLAAPPRPDALNVVLAPKQAAALRVKAFQGLETRFSQGLACLSARLNPPGRPYSYRRWQAAVIGLMMVDLLVAGWGLNPAGPADVYTQPAPTAAELKGLLAAPGGESHRLFMLPAQEQWFTYVRFLRFRTFNPGQDWMDLRAGILPDANLFDGIPTAGNYDPLVPGRFAGWMDALEAAPAQVQTDLLGLMDVALLASNHRFYPHGLRFQPVEAPIARFRWVPCAAAVTGPEQAREKVFSGSLDFTRWVVLEAAAAVPDCLLSSSPLPNSGLPVIGSLPVAASLAETGPNRVQVRFGAPAPGWLVISDTWYPGWRAWVDGQPASLLHANYLFRAVSVEAGEHTVVLEYRPASFSSGLGLSLLGLLAFAGLCFIFNDHA